MKSAKDSNTYGEDSMYLLKFVVHRGRAAVNESSCMKFAME